VPLTVTAMLADLGDGVIKTSVRSSLSFGVPALLLSFGVPVSLFDFVFVGIYNCASHDFKM
jgi:hypothetical protein